MKQKAFSPGRLQVSASGNLSKIKPARMNLDMDKNATAPFYNYYPQQPLSDIVSLRSRRRLAFWPGLQGPL